MTAWLAQVGERLAEGRGEVRIRLGRSAAGVRIGDRVTQLAGRDVGLSVDPAELGRAEGVVRVIEHDLVHRRTEVTCEVRGV